MSTEEHDALKEDVIESMERSAEVYGLSRSAGRVYGELYFAEESLSIPELVENTGYAKSTISNVTRQLTRIGLIRRRSSGGGGRRVEFEPVTDLWFVIQDVLGQYVQREMSTTQRTLEQALDQLEAREESTTIQQERLQELEETYENLETLVELATRHSMDDIITALEQYEE